MAIYAIENNQRIVPISPRSFLEAGVGERADLQRLLHEQVDVISPDTLVIAEEFGDWEDSRRRIDLLGVDKQANLVVIELKRSEDGGHMDLQAIRYASMVFTMTFTQAAEIYGRYLEKVGRDDDPTQALLDFLEWDEADEDEFAQDVRIVLASAEFSKELTTAVMWLNQRNIDIRCIRMKPYQDGERLLLDVQQIIPLPEAEEYTVRIREKQKQERVARKFNPDFTRYDVTVCGETFENLPKRRAIFAVARKLCASGVRPERICDVIPHRRKSLFRSVSGRMTSKEFLAIQSKDDALFHRYWFCAEDELFELDGHTFAFSSRWGSSWRRAMECLVAAFPEHGISFQPSSNDGG